MTTDQLSIERAFLQQKLIDNTIDFDQIKNALSTLGIHASASYVEKIFCELDHDGVGRIDMERFVRLVQQLEVQAAHTDDDNESDEESVSQSNSDKAKAFDKVILLAQTNGSVTLADINALMKEITGKQ